MKHFFLTKHLSLAKPTIIGMVLLVCGTDTKAQTNLVVNGNFESNYTGWTCAAFEINKETTYGGFNAQNYCAELDVQSSLCQSLTGLTKGKTYTVPLNAARRASTACVSGALSFDLPPNNTQVLTVSIDGNIIGTVTRTGKTALGFATDMAKTENFTFTATGISHTLCTSVGRPYYYQRTRQNWNFLQSQEQCFLIATKTKPTHHPNC